MNILESANNSDIDVCWDILADGRRFQREQGFVQWTDDYPNRDTVKDDILSQKGYVLKVDGAIAGYMCIDFSGEPAYESINGSWRSEKNYAVIHRMAFRKIFCGKGLSEASFSLAEKLCIEQGVDYLRIDTAYPNKRMQHILEKNGFKYCGVIKYQGSERLAYDKFL
ncbi:MAG TPA: GNAT family N-acetyltransferase [Candidatus Mediterraneibacter intestinavium]|nr:GNAT family N-acetyltransferase [Candidatus Mediterraneibacter intestinavium]